MSNTTTEDPLFDSAPGGPNDPRPNPNSISTESEQGRINDFKKILDQMIKKKEEKSCIDRFLPYLLIRSTTGDLGNRPINNLFWESPDIWTAAGDPSSSPEVPPNPGGIAIANTPNTLYAHVRNIGDSYCRFKSRILLV